MNGYFADKSKRNFFVSAQSGSFLQSNEWAEFQESTGRKVLFLGVEDNWSALVIKQVLPAGQNYLYVPRGPVFSGKMNGALEDFLSVIRDSATAEKSLFIRIDPFYNDNYDIGIKNFIDLKFIDTGRSVQPKINLVINLDRSEEDLLADMHEKTRYNIRLAQKHNVFVKISTREELDNNKKIFWQLISETTKRQKIRSYEKKYYDKMIESFYHEGTQDHSKAFGRIYFAYYKDKPLGAAFVVFFGKRVTYLHGGTSLEHKNTMSPYLLHWEIMRSAKKEGFSEYDLGGIDEQRWPGITRFKKGFGGMAEQYPNAIDMPVAKVKYSLYKISRKFL